MIQGPSPQGQGPCSIRLQFMENIQTRFLDMKLFKFSVAALLALATAFLGGCSDDDGIDNRDRDYGYVQFKLHKEASYDVVSPGPRNPSSTTFPKPARCRSRSITTARPSPSR